MLEEFMKNIFKSSLTGINIKIREEKEKKELSEC